MAETCATPLSVLEAYELDKLIPELEHELKIAKECLVQMQEAAKLGLAREDTLKAVVEASTLVAGHIVSENRSLRKSKIGVFDELLSAAEQVIQHYLNFGGNYSETRWRVLKEAILKARGEK